MPNQNFNVKLIFDTKIREVNKSGKGRNEYFQQRTTNPLLNENIRRENLKEYVRREKGWERMGKGEEKEGKIKIRKK